MDNQASNDTNVPSDELKSYGGRKYFDNKKIAYILPDDSDESARLNKQHLVLRYVLQTNFIAPVQKKLEEGITVLDSACGPASWTFDMANDFPNSKFYGIDINNTFPNESKPENCDFVLGNVSEEIPFPDNTFDYIHQRLLVLGLTSEMWERNLKELFRVLKPGGYIEIKEPDLKDLDNTGPSSKKLQAALTSVLEARGIPIKIAVELEERITRAGFVNQENMIVKLNLNHNGKAGDMLWDDYRHGYTNLGPLIATMYPEYEDPEAFENFLDECGTEAAKEKSDILWYTSVAQKPLE
ncbi:S-adenosyl-L-methionine-dependent methyltransferase [Pilaira anomala]|nr:S-adenosyl-L-methionine-dependent methyltransferase [Pilaira anomala]